MTASVAELTTFIAPAAACHSPAMNRSCGTRSAAETEEEAVIGSAADGLGVCERLVDRVSEVAHRLELEVVGPLLRGLGRGSPTGTVVAAIDPDRGQAFPLGRDVVVEQALGDVQQL